MSETTHQSPLPEPLAPKLLPLERARAERERLARLGLRLVLTNGVFDLLHAGHVRYLVAARGLGDALFVGLNDDASVRRNKGAERPIQPVGDRATVLAALAAVDGIVIFGEDTAEALVAALRPDVYVKGADYALAAPDKESPAGVEATWGRPLPEAAIVHAYGGKVQLLPYLAGRSTSAIIARIRGEGAR